MARNGRLSQSAIGTILTELGADVESRAKQVLLAGGETILADAKSRVTNTSGKSTGKLSASGSVKPNGKGNVVRITFDAKNDGYNYSRIVEFRPGHEHPYLYPAYDAHRNQVRQNVIDAIRQAVRSHAVT